jgi:hypothetical protein
MVRVQQYWLVSVITVLSMFCAVQVRGQFSVRLVGGLPTYNALGDFVAWYIFAEENAPLSPVPVFELINTKTKVRERLVEKPFNLAATARRKKYIRVPGRRTRSMSLSDTITDNDNVTATIQVAKYGFMEWHVKSAPFGALSATGPKRFYADDNSFIAVDGVRFRTAGFYNVIFNITTLTGQHFRFNRTITVQRQANSIAFTTTAAGYNGSVMFPAPTAQLRDFVGANVATPTASVLLDFQALPLNATVLGTLRRYSTSVGLVAFSDVVPTLPGTYTFRLVATLSDGSQLTTDSQRVTVERALPVSIIVHQGISGIARFRFYTQPIFSIRDAAGPSQDPRMNMTLSIDSNQPDFSYEGGNTIATLGGTPAVMPVNYLYTYTDVSIDLPGNYILRATLILPTGATLSTTLSIRLNDPPTFEVPAPMTVNNPGIITLYGDRPKVSTVSIVLALDEACQRFTSDEVNWPEYETTGAFNITVVPFNEAPSFVCMSIPSHPGYGPLIQRYLPQYDELFPLQYTFNILGVTECTPLPATTAAQFRRAGWETAAPLRRYGCALRPPVAGTIPACSCPTVLTCIEMRHQKFTPPNLNIGQCVCCTTWVMAVAGTVSGLFFAGLLWVIYQYV